ncbi:MAG: hypothetical protein EPN85_13935 [Bacteroidetes bacterium]|nr:MAG: hypothetical protein EPN85_13935 [Bacteroidota bacterium]
MKKITVAVVLFALLTGCTKQFIQIYDTGSTNTQSKDNHFVFENDTLKITYSFWASKGLMSFNIYNKLSKPIYLDWKNSSFIYNDHKLNYWLEEDQANVSEKSNGHSFNGPLNKLRTTMNEGIPNYSSSLVTHEQVTFIPPKSNYDRSQFYLLPVSQCELGLDCQSSVVPRNDKPKRNTTVYGYDFSYSNSPLRFRNYLALSTSQNSQQFSFIDNEFYLTSVKEMDVRHYRGKSTGNNPDGSIIYEYPFSKKTSFFNDLESYYYSVEIRKR